MANDSAAKPRADRPEDHWTLDRRIPLALMLTLMIQIAVGAAAWGAMATKVDNLQKETDKLQAAAQSVAPIREDLAVVKVQLAAVAAQQDRVEAKLDELAR